MFYEKYPNFDWEFYIENYDDLQKHNVDSELKAANHYYNYGSKESRRTHKIIEKSEISQITCIDESHIFNNIKQYYISNGLSNFRDQFTNKFKNLYNLIEYNNNTDNTCFFGVYTDDDLYKLKSHEGIKYIIWGGEDANPKNLVSLSTLNEVQKLSNVIHISISKCIYKSLQNVNINSIYINFNLVDTNLFKKIPSLELGNKIFIFNGQTNNREHIYGKSIYEAVMKRLPQYEYIFSNSLNVKYEEMPEIYKQCFIMIRLTMHDGNANSVQECKAMNIPVIHNQSDYGLEWQNIDDIIRHIQSKCKLSRDVFI